VTAIPLRRVVWFGLLGTLIVVFPYLHGWPVFSRYISEYRTFNMTMFGVWLLVVLGMNLLTGYSGQVSLGHAAAVLVGAYTTGVLFAQYGVPLALAVLIAAAFTGLLGGVVIGLPAVRLRGPYLAIATFAMVISLPQILKMKALTGWTHGANGVRPVHGIPTPGFAAGLSHDQWLYYTTMFSAVVMTVLFWNMTRSRFGRAMIALRDSEIAAEQMGINVPLYKALAFGVSALYAGIAGGLFFQAQAFVGPESLGFFDSILFLVAIVLGGLGTVLGSVIGALFLTFQSELINKIGDWVPQADRLRGVIYGGLLVVTILIFPRGLAWFIQSVLGGRRPTIRVPAFEQLRASLAASLGRRAGQDR
jgi:branched-chain amino acid transport system permease protein